MSHHTIHPDKAKKLFKRQDGRCFYCLQKFASKRTNVRSLRKVTIDHIIPRCELQGLSFREQSTENCVLACRECNSRKANISAELFLKGYEAINIADWDVPSFFIAVKTRGTRYWYHKYFTW